MPVLLPGKSHGERRGLEGCSPRGHEESVTTERLHFHFSLSCIGGGNGNPLQCSCLENPRDGGAWWAAVYGVTQSRAQLKWLSSSSSSSNYTYIIHLSHIKTVKLIKFSPNSDGKASLFFRQPFLLLIMKNLSSNLLKQICYKKKYFNIIVPGIVYLTQQVVVEEYCMEQI